MACSAQYGSRYQDSKFTRTAEEARPATNCLVGLIIRRRVSTSTIFPLTSRMTNPDNAMNQMKTEPANRPSEQPKSESARDLVHAPVRIFLQWNGDQEPDPTETPSLADVTWCADRVFEHDIEYVQSDGLRSLLKEWLEHDLQDGRTVEIIREVERFVYANSDYPTSGQCIEAAKTP